MYARRKSKATDKRVVSISPRGGRAFWGLEEERKGYPYITCFTNGKPVVFDSWTVSASRLPFSETADPLFEAGAFVAQFVIPSLATQIFKILYQGFFI